MYKLGKYTVYVNSDSKVTHATVNTYNGKALVRPYVKSKYGGLDNVSGELTVSQLRDRIRRGTAFLR